MAWHRCQSPLCVQRYCDWQSSCLYTSGLRRGEVIRLALQDVEPQAGVLRICESKFHKSRLIPLSSGGLKRASPLSESAYDTILRQSPIVSSLLCNFAKGKLRSYTGTGLSQGIHALFDAAGVRDNNGRRPRTHDLRHSFALQALMRWYREGVDVQSRLPHLALYMSLTFRLNRRPIIYDLCRLWQPSPVSTLSAISGI